MAETMMARICGALALLLATTLPLAAEPFHHASGEWRERNRDWLAACPDRTMEGVDDYAAFSCFASTGSSQLNGASLPAYTLTLVRNRLTGDLDIAVTVAIDDAAADETGTLTLTFSGGRSFALDFGTDLETRHQTPDQFFVADADVREALLVAMIEGNAVTLSVPIAGVSQPQTVPLSLDGVLASLDFMAAYARRVAEY